MDEPLLNLVAAHALYSACEVPRDTRILGDERTALLIASARVLSAFRVAGAEGGLPKTAIAAELFKVIAGQARTIIPRLKPNAMPSPGTLERADLILATAIEEADDALGESWPTEEFTLSPGAALVEALCVARYALQQAKERGPGWEELAASTVERIDSELEVHGRG